MSEIHPATTAPARRAKPPWLKVPLPGGEGYSRLKGLARDLGLAATCGLAHRVIDVETGVTVDMVDAVLAMDDVTARASGQVIARLAAEDQVIATATEDDHALIGRRCIDYVVTVGREEAAVAGEEAAAGWCADAGRVPLRRCAG